MDQRLWAVKSAEGLSGQIASNGQRCRCVTKHGSFSCPVSMGRWRWYIFGGTSLRLRDQIVEDKVITAKRTETNFDPTFCLGGGIAVLFVLAVQIWRVHSIA